ncbi:MAG: hypothetical protein WC451_02570 [Patescibacteria group bacterium]
MSKFDRYDGLVKFDYDGDSYVIPFTVEDAKEFAKMSEDFKRTRKSDPDFLPMFYLKILMKAYPQEQAEKINNFLSTNLYSFHKQFMIASGLTTKERVDAMEAKMEENFMKLAETENSPASNLGKGTV